MPFIPSAILPSQHAAMHRGNDCSGERRLAIAVIEDAVEELRRTHPRTARLDGHLGGTLAARRRQCIAWFESDDEAWPFAFAALCNHLGLDAEWIRAELKGNGWCPVVAKRRSQPGGGVRAIVPFRANGPRKPATAHGRRWESRRDCRFCGRLLLEADRNLGRCPDVDACERALLGGVA